MKRLLATAAVALLATAPAYADSAADFAALDAAKAQGAIVYDLEGQEIGTVDEMLKDGEGKIERVVLTVGADTPKKVAVPVTDLTLMQDGDETSVEFDATPEEIEALPAHE